MKVAITLTTINKPEVLEEYLKNINHYGHNDIEVIVVGDRKTPSGVDQYCNELSKKSGIIIKYMDIEFQKDYLRRFPALDAYIPYDSFSRRNIGDLYAYEEGFDIIIRVDDDNYPINNEDFIGKHVCVGKTQQVDILKSNSGWFNVCEELVDYENIPFYPRGFPYSKRWQSDNIKKTTDNIRVVLNAGLWLGDPDIDAITRLCKAIDAKKYLRTYGDNFCLDIGTWCPINTQNTSYSREIIPASFVPPNVGRYDDIWSGYLLRKITDHFNHYISYGSPLLLQKRNEHNLWDDLNKEINGNLYTDHLIHVMDNINLIGNSYNDCYYELSKELDENLTENREIFNGVLTGMKIWSETIKLINTK